MGGSLFPGSDILTDRWRTVGNAYRFGLCLIGLGMIAACVFGALLAEAVIYRANGLGIAIASAGFAFLILVLVGTLIEVRAYKRYVERSRTPL
jgi:hypothetical protein